MTRASRAQLLRATFLRPDELVDGPLGDQVLDERSVLVSRFVVVGDGNVFYPGAVVQCDEASTLVIGSDNVFYPGTFLLAERGGRLEVGSHGEYGPGGVQVKADGPESVVSVGDRVRLVNGPEVVGATTIGSGGQVIGPIRVQSAVLAAGGDHREPDVDLRAGVLKGVGLARGTRVGVGEVVNGLGSFADAVTERQSVYHPRP